LRRLNGLKLVPGMPVETFVQSGERTVMCDLAKSLHHKIMKAFRERRERAGARPRGRFVSIPLI
jgi:HlyD family secretion protein